MDMNVYTGTVQVPQVLEVMRTQTYESIKRTEQNKYRSFIS
jgi:hypothetical protein